jgi:hypothetical protein
MISEQWIGKDVEEKSRCVKKVFSRYLAGGTQEYHYKTSGKTSDLRAEIWTQDPPNLNQDF